MATPITSSHNDPEMCLLGIDLLRLHPAPQALEALPVGLIYRIDCYISQASWQARASGTSRALLSLLISFLGMSGPGPFGPGPDASSRFDQQLPAQVFNAPNSCWICVIGLNTEIVPLPPQLMPTSTTLGKVVIRKTGEPLSPPAFP
jgi:hypothetical protein